MLNPQLLLKFPSLLFVRHNLSNQLLDGWENLFLSIQTIESGRLSSLGQDVMSKGYPS
jgi:hypothetical protein